MAVHHEQENGRRPSGRESAGAREGGHSDGQDGALGEAATVKKPVAAETGTKGMGRHRNGFDPTFRSPLCLNVEFSG
jgi:hypothetical protein